MIGIAPSTVRTYVQPVFPGFVSSVSNRSFTGGLIGASTRAELTTTLTTKRVNIGGQYSLWWTDYCTDYSVRTLADSYHPAFHVGNT